MPEEIKKELGTDESMPKEQMHVPEQQSPTTIEQPPQETFSVTVEQAGVPEAVETPEEEGSIERAIEGLKKRLRKPKKGATTIPQVRDEVTVQVEKIMEEGLADAYKELTPVQQQEFKIKGEQTANEIRQLLKKTHVQIKKIFRLLLEWLKILPGINIFFLEQEAKIKADKIMALRHKDKHK